MNIVERMEDAVIADRDLLELELLIARRADELAHSLGRSGDEVSDWECWLEAEKQVLQQRAEEPVPA